MPAVQGTDRTKALRLGQTLVHPRGEVWSHGENIIGLGAGICSIGGRGVAGSNGNRMYSLATKEVMSETRGVECLRSAKFDFRPARLLVEWERTVDNFLPLLGELPFLYLSES